MGAENDIIELSIDEYSKSINDFSQDFLRMVTILLVVFLNLIKNAQFRNHISLIYKIRLIVLLIGLVGPSEFRVLAIKVELKITCENRRTVSFIKYIFNLTENRITKHYLFIIAMILTIFIKVCT